MHPAHRPSANNADPHVESLQLSIKSNCERHTSSVSWHASSSKHLNDKQIVSTSRGGETLPKRVQPANLLPIKRQVIHDCKYANTAHCSSDLGNQVASH